MNERRELLRANREMRRLLDMAQRVLRRETSKSRKAQPHISTYRVLGRIEAWKRPLFTFDEDGEKKA